MVQHWRTLKEKSFKIQYFNQINPFTYHAICNQYIEMFFCHIRIYIIYYSKIESNNTNDTLHPAFVAPNALQLL